ncbi:MAG: hypothetical protein BGP03_19165 [Pseudonocardia sp. 73-21]|nr:MAG: hypothetical protein BGP03_19165 [Pseudonocardia sp. 73-21]
MLRSAGGAYAPRPDEKARARARLMAMLAQPEAAAPDDAVTTVMPAVTAVAPAVEPSVADEPDEDLVPLVRAGRRPGRHTLPRSMSSRPEGRPRGRARSTARGLSRRALVLGAAALVAVVAAAGGSIFASRDALPGDALYPVKRVAESAGLAMTFDKSAKAHRQLELATTRLDEVEKLVTTNPAGIAADPQLVQSAIQDFDSSTGDGSRALMDSEDAGGSAALGDLRAWAGEQAAKLSVLRSALPTSTVPGADDSISLLDRLLGRTQALSDRSNCARVTSGTVDDLGPLPATGTCSPRTAGSEGTGGTTGSGESTTDDPSAPGAGTGPGAPSTAPRTGAPAQGLVPSTDGADAPGTSTDAPSSAPTTAPSGGNISVPVPLPLLPPINLPPLLPGMPGVTIG